MQKFASLRRFILPLVVALIGATAAFVAVDTQAVFTEQELNPTNVFTVGTLDLVDTPDSATFTVSGMVPGDAVTQQLTLANGGTIDLRYAMTTSATDDCPGLCDDLTLEIRVKAAGSCAADFTGTVVVSPAVSLSGAAFGDPSQGSQAGDRTLTVSASEDLCFRVELPLAASPDQGVSTDVTFVFDAEQTANNP